MSASASSPRVALVLCLAAPPAMAHDGPPYPILVDEPVAGHVLSVWADPDVGEGTFYLYLPAEEESPDPALSVRLHARPLDGAFAERSSAATPAEGRVPYQRIATLEFPDRGRWNVRFVLETPEGLGEVATDVDVTPPGGRFGFVWLLSPFLLFGFVWLKAFFDRRSRQASTRT